MLLEKLAGFKPTKAVEKFVFKPITKKASMIDRSKLAKLCPEGKKKLEILKKIIKAK